MGQLKKDTYYENTVVVMSPHGMVEEGRVFSGDEWADILVYEIGNSGVESMFKIVDKPKAE